MGSVDDISQLCRLCLVKDQVNIPIFDENSDLAQTSVKINSCLPVKVSRDDNLPKKICDGCSYKLDMLYIFRNTSVDSEKKLIQWLNQAGLSTISQTTVKDPLASTKPEVTVKQETFEPSDSRLEGDASDMAEADSYLMQEMPYQQEFEFAEASGSNPELTDEPPPKRAKRAAALKAAPIEDETDDQEAEDDLDAAMQITKAEDEDSEDVDQPDYVEAPSTSTDDQPGPSGVGKPAVEAPSEEEEVSYLCNVCAQQFENETDFLNHHVATDDQTFNCCKCDSQFQAITDLYAHLEEHSAGTVVVNEDSEEIVLDYEGEEDGNEVLYILDDSQCVNEVVVDENLRQKNKAKKVDNYKIVQLRAEHGYVIRNVVEEKTGEKQVVEASTSKVAYQPRPRAPQPKRRHVVPDFSAANYQFINANDEVDIAHYKCLRCEQLFINKFVFFRHIEKGKCYINNCDVCNATFTKNSDFYYHYMVEHKDRAICNFCFRTFMYEKNVKEHMMRHLDQFRHRCDQCNKGFYTVREYRNHYKNRHMGIRHKCNVCSRSFADEYYFRRHMATHEQTAIVLE